MKRILFVLLASLGLFGQTGTSRADGFIVVDSAHWIPGPPPQRHPPGWIPRPPQPRPYAPLEVAFHHLDVKINGQIATTSVDQEFFNPNPTQLEGTYLFPVPKGAQIDKFTMDIGGRMVEAELLSADKARKIYEDIVRRAKDPALMEYADRDVFKVRIFPIEPNSRKRVKLSYTQVLKADSGLIAYTYPLNTEKFSSKPVKNVSIKVELTSDRPLKSIYSPSHAVEIKRHGSTRATVGFEANDTHPDSDFTLYFAPEKDELGVNLLTHRISGEDGHFLMLISPGADVKDKGVMPKDVAFVLDTSGSMAGKKLEQAKRALQFCVENLNAGDRFEIIRFSTEVEPLFDTLVDASPRNRDRAQEFIQDLKPIGGTAIDDALAKALGLKSVTDRPYVIIFLTDGKPTIGTTDENQIVENVKRANGNRTRIFCFGIGTDVNTHLLDKITEGTRAFSQYVLPEEDLEVKVSNFFSKIKEPVLANPALKFSGDVRVTKLYPSPLPDVFRGDQLLLAGCFTGKGDAAVILEGTVNGVRRKFTYEVTLPRVSRDHEFIPRLWATRRVGYLLDEIRLRGENSELRDEVTALAREYGIVTPYTAYLIVEDEARRGVPVSVQSLPQIYSDSAVRKEAADNWSTFNSAKDGEKAVAGARYGLALKSASAPASAAFEGSIEANRALGGEVFVRRYGGSGGGSTPLAPTAPAQDSKERLAQYSQQGRFINGKNFYQNASQWVDATVQQSSQSKRQRIQFNSTEYFAFAAKESRALPFLALGQNVQFVLDDTVYEIYDN
jgi:Ca-activated chloride channel family protein